MVPLLLPKIIRYTPVFYDDAICVMPISLPHPTLLRAGRVRLNVFGSGFLQGSYGNETNSLFNVLAT